MHDPVAIWCYLKPVLEYITANYPAVSDINFFSDGPTTQYRQKKNFYLFSSMLSCFKSATWNFFEASHGKGAADGVGAVLKRTADRMVRQGADLPNARTVFEKLQGETAVKLFFVGNDLVDHAMVSSEYLAALPSVPGTMMLHQISIDCSVTGKLHYRDVSCFCSQLDSNVMCTCFEPRSFEFPLIHPLSMESLPDNETCVETPDSNTVCHSGDSAIPVDLQKNIRRVDKHDASLIGQFCVVTYNGKPYPGKIVSIDENDAEVDCMHFIGNRFKNRFNSNRFFWPEKVKDICFYPFDNIVSLIPEPQTISDHGRSSRHFCVLPSIWNEILNEVQST